MNTDRMSCGEVREKLPLFVGNDLDADVLDAVRGHLDLCAECARLAGKVAAARHGLVSAFRAQAGDNAGPALWPGIRATLQAEGLIHPAGEAVPEAPVLRVRRARWTAKRLTWALAPLAAAAVLLLLVQVAGVFGSGAGSKVLPGPQGPRARPALGIPGLEIPGLEIADTPRSAPVGGTLERIDASQVGPLPAPYARARRGESPAPVFGGASLAGYKRIK